MSFTDQTGGGASLSTAERSTRPPVKPSRTPVLEGLENCLFPTFDAAGQRLNRAGIEWDVRHSIGHGFTSTMLPLEIGLSFEECCEFIDIAVAAAGNKIDVSMILLRDSIEENIAVLTHAEQAGVHHATLGYPAEFRPESIDEVLVATEAMCTATNLGIVLYASERFDFRFLHPSGLLFPVFDEMVKLPNVIGMKVGFPDPGVVYECFRRYSHLIDVNIGTAGMLGMFPLLHRRYPVDWGGAGMWEAWQSPEKPYMVEYFDLVRRGRYAEALKLHWFLMPAHQQAIRFLGDKHLVGGADLGFQNGLIGKYLVWSVGGHGGPLRAPARHVTAAQRRVRSEALRAIGIEPDEQYDTFLHGRSAPREKAHE